MIGAEGQRTGPGVVALVAVAIAGLLFLAVPVLIIIIGSFGSADYLEFPPGSLSLRWYKQFLGNRSWLRAIDISVRVAALTAMFSTLLGLFASIALVRGRLKARGAIYAFLLSPLMVPTIITAIALYFFFAPLGGVGSVFAMAAGHTVLAVPIVVSIVTATLEGFDERLEQAALSLGASRLTALYRITLPLILPGVVSAALFAFMISFDEVLIPLFLSAATRPTLTVRIWNSLILDVSPEITAVSSFLIGLTMVVFLASTLLRRWVGTKAH